MFNFLTRNPFDRISALRTTQENNYRVEAVRVHVRKLVRVRTHTTAVEKYRNMAKVGPMAERAEKYHSVAMVVILVHSTLEKRDRY